MLTQFGLPDREVRALPARFVLGVLAPQLLFYLGLRSAGLAAALVIAGGWTVALQVHDLVRRRTLDPFLVYGLLFTLAQGAAALVTRNPAVYAGGGVVENVIWGAVLAGSLLFCRPVLVKMLATVIGEHAVVTVPVRAALWSLTAGWAALFLIRSAGLYIALTHLPIGPFLAVSTVSGWPLNGLAMLVSLLYLRGRVRRASTEQAFVCPRSPAMPVIR